MFWDSRRTAAALLLGLSLLPSSLAAKPAKPKNAILLSEVQSLTLRAGKLTSHRRVPAVPQLTCSSSPSGICALHIIDVMRCTNQGSSYDDEDIQWSCTASLPPELKLGATEVVCEGYSNSDDPYVLRGSCAVEYRLLLTDYGEQKFPDLVEPSTFWETMSEKTSEDWAGYAFFLLFLAILAWIVWSAFMSANDNNNNNRHAPPAGDNRRPWGGGGGGGDDGWDDPPPPYSGGRKPPPAPTAPPSEGWQPGFWTGMAGGAAAGYYAGRSSERNRYRNDYYNGPGGYAARGYGPGGGGGGGWGGSSYASSSNTRTTSSARRESTGFGSTRRR